ncbi:IucA/IucC family protein, partial [Staphylococcus aureus]|uniref:IucA/IucC family protein n=1 Tax=Staphylococcus aureus TaxID=1280 RepID=UPI00065BFF17
GIRVVEYQVYEAGLNQLFPLLVEAVKKTHMINGDNANMDELENLIVFIKEQATEMLNNKGLSIVEYVLFMVHTWQYKHIMKNV